jgi:hypothetical protein
MATWIVAHEKKLRSVSKANNVFIVNSFPQMNNALV